ncbi:uncharacterized protein LOC121737213 [Aricia agestis]|uniref:uncharacterized protein LOC121737213 n=1 Tax=Aricia agestis TaxID=91739 RepID=UPI001C208916|nr:uncharacterized protein LOC121737213 [Aricia agestis]
MSKLHEDYYLRKCCLEKNEVPSRSVMRKKMGSLADVYFKSMSQNLKVIAGLEPPLKGGGANWYMPPEDLLKGRAVLKPVERKFLSKFGCDGILHFGKKYVDKHRRALAVEKNNFILKSDENWRKTVVKRKLEEWDKVSDREQKKNTLKIKQAVQEFSVLYRTSLTKIESLLRDTAQIELERIKNYTYDEMHKKFERLQEVQRKELFKSYKEILESEKSKCKEKFLQDIENLRANFEKNISEINSEKYTALEKLRTILGYQNLACQVYVALKERTECEREVEASKREHEKSIKLLSEQINIKDEKISSTVEEIMKQNELNRLWQNKVRHVVRRFQEFVKYCLHTMPEQAEFFINMERLMLMQLCEALDNPCATSIFEVEDEQVQTDAPKPEPFILVCDETTRPHIDPNLCPQHGTSSQMSVIVVNKRCIYAACDNLELLGDKLEQYLAGKDLNDGAFDAHDYDMDVPIRCTSSEQLLDLKLESSLMQILQDEFLKIRPVVTQCAICGSHYCFCTPKRRESNVIVQSGKTSSKPVKELDKAGILKFTREPKISSYLDYIRPNKCECAMKVKKHLKEHLPAYMKNVSAFEKGDVPQYESCDIHQLQKLVKEAQNIKETNTQAEERTKDVATQYSDQEFKALSEIFSDAEIQRFLKELETITEVKDKTQFKCHPPASYLTRNAETFAFGTVRKPQLEEIFKSKNL